MQVIVGTFLIDTKKRANSGAKNDASASAPVGGASVSNMAFCSPPEVSGPNPFGRNDDQQTGEGSHFMQSMHVTPSRPMDWTSVDVRSSGGFMTGSITHNLPSIFCCLIISLLC